MALSLGLRPAVRHEQPIVKPQLTVCYVTSEKAVCGSRMADAELNDQFSQLVDAQLRFQVQLGDLARLFREKAELQDQRIG
jgi:hypothetical protein